MVVLSAAVCTKNGKALMSRQFVDMTRIRIEGLLAAFPKLLGTGNQQHTFIETDSVRYVYQPIEGLFLLLITNKASNIVEDLETLRLLSKVLPDIAQGVTEEAVQGKMFELVFAFDEVITTGGYREQISLQQIQTNLSMESHEEKLHKMIEQSKVASAKDEADRKAKTIREERKKMEGIGGGSSMSGGGGGSMEGGMGGGGSDAFGSNGGGGFDPTGGSSSPYGGGSSSPFGGSSEPPPPAEPVKKVKGMSLGMKSKKEMQMDKLVAEDNLTPVPPAGGEAAAVSATAAPAAAPQVTHPVTIVMEERVNAALNREGALESLEIKGTMTLTPTVDEACKCKVAIAGTKNELFAFQTHPKVDKKAYEASGTLQLKDLTKGFPKGKPVGVLRWSMSTQDDDQVPISINCWPEEDGQDMNVNVEYNVNSVHELHNVCISIPLGTSNVPQIISMDSGTHTHSRNAEELIWEIPLIDAANKSGTLEFNVQQKDSDAFFPINISFGSQQLHAGIDVGAVISTESNAPVQFGLTKGLVTESYKIE